MKRSFCSAIRLWLVCLPVFGAFGAVGVRLYFLHVVKAEQAILAVESSRRDTQVLSARRGDILDRNGNLLATSRPIIKVGVDPQMPRPEDVARIPALAGLLQIPERDIVSAFARKFTSRIPGSEPRAIRWVPLGDPVDEGIYEQIRELGIRGVYGNREFRRTYPAGSLAAHLIGFVNYEGAAVMGVERYLDFFLKGEAGWRESERDGRRRELAQFRTREILPTDGCHAVLSLDSVVQHTIEAELREIVARFNPVGATIIVSDLRADHEGFILGLANYPSFNPNRFYESDAASQRNRAISDMYEPGSTFKIVASSAAFEEGLVRPDTVFDCSEDAVVYRGRQLRLPGDTHHYGVLSVADIVIKSSNRGAARLGLLLGPSRLYHYAAAFGFGSAADVGLIGEIDGLLHPIENWDALTITRLPMGHAVGATPLQVHTAMGVIACGGVLMRPQIVERITNNQGETVVEYHPDARRRVISERTAREMASLLMRVVSPEGTAPQAAIDGFEVAGKTGTTQKIVDGRYSNRHHVGSFVGFFPARNPELAISVIIDDARINGTAYGSTVAAPSFKVIAEQLIQYLGVSPPAPSAGNLNLASLDLRSASRRDRFR